MGEKRVTILLPEDLDQWINERARKEDRSVAAQLRIMIREAKERSDANADAVA